MIVKFCNAPTEISTDFQALFPSKFRARDYFSSRTALKLALEELDDSYSKLNIMDIKIDNHQHLVGAPSILVSLSHTKEFAAAVATNDSDLKSIGIDIELLSRPFKESSLRMIEHDFDHVPEKLLPFWAMKEACFKAAYPLYSDKKEKALILKDIWIQGTTFGIFDDHNPIGKVSIEKRDELGESFWLAVATI